MKINFPEILDILTDNTQLKYELISVLSNVQTNTKNLNINEVIYINRKNQDNYKLFIKNFINNKWYMNNKVLQNKEINGDIEQIINKDDVKPTLLIYKKIK